LEPVTREVGEAAVVRAGGVTTALLVLTRWCPSSNRPSVCRRRAA